MRRFAGWWCLAAAVSLLGACAAPSGPGGASPEGVSGGPESRIHAGSPVLGFSESAETAEEARQARLSAAISRPLDAANLPPFDGQREEMKRPPSLARVDRTIRHDDLWKRIRDGFSMPDLSGPLVDEKTAWYVARPDYLRRVFERSRLYLYHIVDELEKRGLPTELALLPMVESSFNPMAYSRAHASGLWQFIPGTGKRYDLAQNWWYDGRRDIVASTSAALDYLKDIYDMHGDWHLALASYNWGENAVARALEKNRREGRPLDYMSLTMPAETRHYVPKLQALKNIVSSPALFGVVLDPIPNQPYFATVNRASDIDVRLAARLAEMSVEEFVALNPGFNRPVIRAEQTPRIVLPADRVDVFHDNLAKLDDKALVSWQTYQPRRGDSLETIARKFGVGIAQLREVNGIGPRTRTLPAVLVVPTNGAKDLGRLPIMYAPPIPASRARSITHTVKPGETLPAIAGRYRVSVEDLRRWNKIGRLAAGQTLTIHTKATPARSSKPPKGKQRKPSPPKKTKK